MNLTELGAALGPFFDAPGSPSHNQLRDAFTRHGLSHLDPAPDGRTLNGTHLGKMKRVRHMFASPTAHTMTAGLPLGSVPGSGVSDGGVSVPDVRGPSRESLW